jgi:hypothetical protein
MFFYKTLKMYFLSVFLVPLFPINLPKRILRKKINKKLILLKKRLKLKGF